MEEDEEIIDAANEDLERQAVLAGISGGSGGAESQRCMLVEYGELRVDDVSVGLLSWISCCGSKFSDKALIPSVSISASSCKESVPLSTLRLEPIPVTIDL